ncbi:hypothetical protein [Mycobacterium spongiae]|uniref:Uncharacterized protein n=1 Tax=Mycobacterium spongiae TaxID=886343 RepID=A0A975PXB0_9MYCO|nr:hypothetical protein [Mycobacterium spongiae]QUR67917.1 hypothetical protein F6B93_13115 [Mycobacterium spongiae]
MTISSDPGSYGSAADKPPPVPVAPGPVQPAGTSTVGVGMHAFTTSTNADLGLTNAEIAEDDADRRAHAADAAAKFPENEADAARQFEGMDAQGMAQMIPQMASGIGGAISGAAGGMLGPLTQIPQQAMQAGQGAIQPLMGALQQAGGAEGLDALDDAALVGDLDAEPGLGAGGGAGGIGAGGLGGGTTPTGYLGPPPVPTSSPPTTPAGAAAKSAAISPGAGTPPASTSMGPTGMPMVPPGAMGARGEGGGSKDKPTEKRVTVPGVPHGQPVKGRLTVPPSKPVTKSAEAKPTVSRRILLPDHKESGRTIQDEKADTSE